MPDEPANPDPAPVDDPPPADPPAPEPDKPLGEAGEKALEAMKVRARDAEKAAKAATAELEKMRKASMSDNEKAITEAEERGRQAATKAVGEKLAAAEIKAALTGVVPDPSALIEDLALGRYVTEEGDVDSEAVSKLAEKYAALGAVKPPPPGVPAGARPGSEVKQLTQADLGSMTPSQIVEARRKGQFADLLAGGPK